VLPAPVAAPASHASGSAVGAMREALSAPGVRGRGWLVATGALTNVALLFAVHPRLADDVAGLSVMGGAVGGFFSNAPLGRMRERLELRGSVYRHFPAGLPDEARNDELVKRFRELGILDEGVDDGKACLLLDQARRSFGNSTPYAEFNVGSSALERA
jgi:Inosine-uridine preferring nucleoside hydrolase